MSEVCGQPGFLHWKALGFVLRPIHTDYANYYITGHWKTGPKGLPAWGATTPTHTVEKHGGAGSPGPPLRVPTPMNLSEHLTDWLGVSTVELCGWKKRDLEICASPKVEGQRPPSIPLPEKWGVSAPLAPPCSYAMYCPWRQFAVPWMHLILPARMQTSLPLASFTQPTCPSAPELAQAGSPDCL